MFIWPVGKLADSRENTRGRRRSVSWPVRIYAESCWTRAGFESQTGWGWDRKGPGDLQMNVFLFRPSSWLAQGPMVTEEPSGNLGPVSCLLDGLFPCPPVIAVIPGWSQALPLWPGRVWDYQGQLGQPEHHMTEECLFIARWVFSGPSILASIFCLFLFPKRDLITPSPALL